MDGDMLWIDAAKGSDRWRAVVNSVMNIRIHKVLEFFDWLRN